MATPILMRRDLGAAIPAPHWREGFGLVNLKTVSPATLHALMKAAYLDGGIDSDAATMPESWWTATRNDTEFDPELCFIARAPTGDIIGFALVWNSSFIKDFVVAPGWQRRGIGTVLMSEILTTLSARGFHEVALKVDAGNLRAKLLYRRMGFVESA